MILSGQANRAAIVVFFCPLESLNKLKTMINFRNYFSNMKPLFKFVTMLCIWSGFLELLAACLLHSPYSLTLSSLNFFVACLLWRSNKRYNYWDEKIKEAREDRQKINLLYLKGDTEGINKILEKYPNPRKRKK